MTIDEEDIFNFVYNPKFLEDKKRLFIQKNVEKYSNEINFYTLLKAQQSIPVPKEIEDEIVEKINSYNHPKLKFLKEDSNTVFENNDKIQSGKTSIKLDEGKPADTYIDENSNFIVKIVYSENSSSIYLTNKDNTPIKYYSIAINSTKEIYFREDNSEPVVVSGRIEMKDIRLSFE